MQTVHISQFYSTTQVTVSSELYYISQLAFYLSKNEQVLDVDGVIFDKVLQKSDFWNYFLQMIKEGYIVNTGIMPPTFIDEVNVFTKDLTLPEYEPRFEYKNNAEWKFSIKGASTDDSNKNQINLNTTLRSQAWVSLVAMVAVERFKTGFPRKLLVDLESWVTYQAMGAADIIVLYEDTVALQNWVELSIEDKLKAYYEAWYYKNQERGYMNKFVYVKDKLQWLKENNIGVGDPVFLYTRDVKRKDDLVKGILDCNIAVIRKITKDTIVLDVLNTKETRYSTKMRFENYSDGVQALYEYHNTLLERPPFRTKSYNLLDIGMDKLLYAEEFFISDVNKSDMVVLEDTLGGKELKFELTPQQAVYWILKDWKIPFESEKYIDTYVKEGKTVYDIFQAKKMESAGENEQDK